MTLRAGYKCDCGRTIEVIVREYTEGLEAQPEMVQSVVGAAGCGVKQGESGVGASRQIIAKLKTWIRNCYDADFDGDFANTFSGGEDEAARKILQYLESIEAAAQEQDVL